jgi:hypothetical protein
MAQTGELDVIVGSPGAQQPGDTSNVVEEVATGVFDVFGAVVA